MLARRYRSALTGILALLTLLAILPGAHAQHQAFVRFGQRDGLKNQDISAMAQDSHGVLWIGTENGLFQMIGSAFIRVPCFEHGIYGGVTSIHTDAQGRVWVMGDNGLVSFDPDASLHQLPRVHISLRIADLGSIDSLSGIADTIFLLKGGRLDAVRSTDHGVTWDAAPVFSAVQIAAHPEVRQFTSIVSDGARNTLWLGCGTAICEIAFPRRGAGALAPSVTIWDSRAGVPALRWTALLHAHDGSIWARGYGQVIRIDPQTRAVARYGDPSLGKHPDVLYAMLAEDHNGAVLANLPIGVTRLERGEWRPFGAIQGMPPSAVAQMYFDHAGGLWLAPIGLGLWRWQGYGHWQHWTPAEGLVSPVTWAIQRDHNGILWAAATEDLYRVSPDGSRVIAQGSGRPMQTVQTVAADLRGHVWTGTTGGTLIDYDPATGRARTVGQGLGFVFTLLEDRTLRHQPALDRIWIATKTGIYYVSAEDDFAVVHPSDDPGQRPHETFHMVQDAAGILYCASRGEIYRHAAGRWARLERPAGITLLGHAILTPAADGTLWVAATMPNPIVHLRVDGLRLRIIERIPASTIPTDDVISLAVDRRQWIWAGTDEGVYVFNGSIWIHCTEEDGLISNDMDRNGLFEDADGSMWFGSSGGISHLVDPESLFRASAPSLQVRSVRLGSLDVPATQPLRIELRHPELAVEMFSNQYDRPRSVAFRYRLAGFADEWQTTTAGRLTFSDLRPGDYTFLMQAVDTRATSTSPSVRYAFTVLPPWYGRPGYRLLGGVLLALAIAAGWRISLRRLRNSEANLKRRVDQQTAELLADKERLECAQKNLVEISRRDALTGLLNRSAIFSVLEEKRATALREGTSLAVIMADLDHFKSINDRFGHAVGDAVLVECCRRLCAALRPHDAIGRYGGEEILLLIPELPIEHAPDRLESLRAAVADRPIRYDRHVLNVSCSFGVGWLNTSHPVGHEALAQADQALYRAKGQGRNCVRFSVLDATPPALGHIELPPLPAPVRLTLQN